jgi:putative phosphoesterase
MKWLIASDIHGSAYSCRKLIDCFVRESAERMLLLGDVLYHGPRNDLPREYAPKEVIELLNARRDDILCVRGNCDTEVDQMVLQFPMMADYAFLELEGRTLFATHGHHFNTQNPPPLRKGEVLLHGHTHVPAWENQGDYWYLNPGSVSIPKENTARGYITLTGGVFRWKALNGEEYHVLESLE